MKTRDLTGYLPFALFLIFAVIVAYGMYKGIPKHKKEE